jgi:hypothetical protein
MAVTVTIADSGEYNGRGWMRVLIEETSIAATTESLIPNLFERGTIVSFKATLTAGTGTTINPKLGYSSGWTSSTQADLSTQLTTAAHINDQTALKYDTGDYTARSLYLESTPNDATADHAISTELLILEGWW